MSLSRAARDWRHIDDKCCEVMHPWDESCFRTTVGMFYRMVPRCFRLYLPLYTISDLLIHGFSLKMLVTRTLPNVIRSTTFLSVQGTLLLTVSCLLRRLLGHFYLYTPVFLPMLTSSFIGILIERKERRSPLATYACMEALYGLYYAFKSRGMVTPLPHGEVLLFSFAMSLLCHSMEHNGRDISVSILRFLLTPHFPIVNGSIVESLCHTTSLRQYPKITFLLSLAETGCWSFLLGYCGKSLGSAITGFLKKRNFSNLLRPWSHYNNVQLGLFLGVLTMIYKLALAIFRRLLLPLSKASYLAGAVAGMSMMLWKSPSTALYTAVKAIEIVYWKMAGNGLLPIIHHADVPIYSLATAIIVHLSLYEPDHITKHYWTFIRNITGNRVAEFNFQKLYPMGVAPSKRYSQPDADPDDYSQKHRT
ncbi:transmembrane protein 135-like [Dysidea avara]|uniref:transmembrane protein 135-like n=1 Tax=Dysidea avara TaxID=196820 RepID=UPI00332CEC60